MQTLEIVLKSGATLKVKAENWSITKNTELNTIAEFKADSIEPRLPYLCLAEIAAIVAR